MQKRLMEILKTNKKKNIALYGQPLRDINNCNEKLPFNMFEINLEPEEEVRDANVLIAIDQVVYYQIDTFILACQLISKRDIFLQLMDYCREYNADIYDERGRDISKIYKEALECSICDKEKLLREIESHECISFDIFDTLLMRKTLYPEDVFDLIEKKVNESEVHIKKLKDKRIEAQSVLGLSNPDLGDIYESFYQRYKTSRMILDLCQAYEIEMEKEVLVAREDMVELYKKCLLLGKKVSLVSDMYLPANVLETILSDLGITGYHNIYISCEKKQLKLQGLLETYKAEVEGESYLHIGDHLIHDGICAGLAGIDYCLIENGFKMARDTFFCESIQKAESLEEHLMLGITIARLCNSPFRQKDKDGRFEILCDYEFGFGFCAAVISQFALWLYSEVKKEKPHEILFASRDGYLIQKLYQLIIQKRKDDDIPKGKYFYTSRKSAVMTGINNEAFINMIIDISSGMPPKKIMKERFGLTAKEILPYDIEKYGDSIHAYVWDHAEAIFRRADKAKANYFKYMGNIGLGIGKKYIFMDFVSSGTCQKSLKRIVPFEIKGVYTGWNGADDKSDVGVSALFEGDMFYFMKHYKMIETFMTSEEPSLSCFDENGNPIFARQDRTKKELMYVKHMQESCIDFLDQLLQLVDPWESNIHNQFTDSVFAAGEMVCIKDGESVLNHLTLMDDWRRRRNKIEQLIQ